MNKHITKSRVWVPDPSKIEGTEEVFKFLQIYLEINKMLNMNEE